MPDSIKLTEYSHGAGCGCKISPATLEKIIGNTSSDFTDPFLLVGNSTKDDAAAYDLGNGDVILSTTDFFMPIADDPLDFGRIAATNAISDIYAMGGDPIMAIAILGWPVNILPADVAAQVIEGGRQVCHAAGIQLAGGHSIDSPEPIFGLAVTGRVAKANLRRNASANAGDQLYLTKPLGIGILTTAQKQKKLAEEDAFIARDLMCVLNKVGSRLATIDGVSALTDVTGFGLAGHLSEICVASGLVAQLSFDAIPVIPQAKHYLNQGCIPGGTQRNFDSYGEDLSPLNEQQKQILCDPQTSGGLLIAVNPDAVDAVEACLKANNTPIHRIGELTPWNSGPRVVIDS
ncbi:selenide, water dikinase [Teredinibacter turnerae T7901]|uniref:Selenide, water dikinase n=1 Tax=Teredinibacter turnerae (strain ATCC 39867 / T7901) TaxID=377629 RepID=C5BQQ7_TERTT|nr:selenide, water dikinase SelD [Teredinibacter turnerae]ACR12094.1 selenide, water dikinase [Teredinibacter turnerae T7901]